MAKDDRYIPALNQHWLTPIYDWAISGMMPERSLKRRLIEQACIEPGQHVLDLGAGTGTLTIMTKQAQPEALLIGLDGDPDILAIARHKAEAAGLEIGFDHGLATQLPYEDGYFDRVLSSLVFHHLSTEAKQAALREIWRVLRLGGQLHLLDIGKPQNAIAGAIAFVLARLEPTADNIRGLLPAMFRQAGFECVAVTAQQLTAIGTLAFYQGSKPV
jgi:ubiquinone/menaquinone biosynthesis C-methylase UbiE